MAKHLNTIFPIVGIIPKLFGTETKEEFRSKLLETDIKSSLKDEFELGEAEVINENETTVKNYIPGATQIPLQMLLDAGFTINAYLKDDTEDCIDDKKGSGVIIVSIQHEDPRKAYLTDGFSMNLDPITEIEVSTLSTLILGKEVPGVFGPKYDLNELAKTSSLRIRDILLDRAEARRLRQEKIDEYNKNPELREKHTKKAFENLKFKFSQIKDKKDADKSAEFTKGALSILGQIAGINNLKSFDELKSIPMFKKEIDAGGSFGELLIKFSDMAEKLVPKENNDSTQAQEADQL